VAAAGQPTIDALGQFELHNSLGAIGRSVNFTQSNLFMLIGVALVLAFMYYGARPAQVVPGRLQAAAEMSYGFCLKLATDQIGAEGVRFFPFAFAFFFVLMGNVLGLFPYAFTYTSHIAVTGALAVMVIVFVTFVAIRENGKHFFLTYFMPEGAPKILAPLIIPIEVISYLSRPVSLSIRLFANMVAGHVMLEVFATFTIMLGGASILWDAISVGPILINVVLMGFEFLVAFLQAYVFAILTCIYLHDAVHLH
jgi:F-type H+-transporting ATPase subunit a